MRQTPTNSRSPRCPGSAGILADGVPAHSQVAGNVSNRSPSWCAVEEGGNCTSIALRCARKSERPPAFKASPGYSRATILETAAPGTSTSTSTRIRPSQTPRSCRWCTISRRGPSHGARHQRAVLQFWFVGEGEQLRTDLVRQPVTSPSEGGQGRRDRLDQAPLFRRDEDTPDGDHRYAAISGTGTSASLIDQQRAIQVLGKTDRRRLPDRQLIRSARSNLDAQLVR